jgi:hypothetical protein
MRPVVDAAVIAALRNQVIKHNKANPAARVKLQELKKIWMRGYRHGRSPAAEAAVNKHLAKRLRAVVATPESIEALAKAGDFEEAKVRRDADGKFASKGGPPGGRREAFQDVRTERQHQKLRAENEGYRAETTQVIQNTFGQNFFPWIGAGAATAFAAGNTAFADKIGDDRFSRAFRRGVSRAVSGPIGAMVGPAGYYATKAVNLARGKAGIAPADPASVGMKVRNTTRRGVERAVQGGMRAMDNAYFFVPRKVIQYAKADADLKGSKGWRRGLRVGVLGRAPAAAIGAGAGMLLTAPLAYRAGKEIGPMYDYMTPRRVEKLVGIPASAESAEALAKAAVPGAAALVSRLKAALARMKPAPRVAPKVSAGSKKARREMGMIRRSPAVAATLGGLAGGALAGGAAYGARRYYRDEDGKFTSKDRDVTGMGLAGGALAGALGGLAFARGRNRALAGKLAEEARNIKVTWKKPDSDQAGAILDGRNMLLGEALAEARAGKIKLKDVSLRVGFDQENKAGQKAATNIQRRINALEDANKKKIDADATARANLRGEIRTAHSASPEAWQEYQIASVLRDQVRALIKDDAFVNPSRLRGLDDKAVKALPKADQDLIAQRKIARDIVRNTDNSSLETVIDHVRRVRAAEAAGKKPPKRESWDRLTDEQKTAFSSIVQRADDALEAYRADARQLNDLAPRLDALKAQRQAAVDAAKAEDATDAAKKAAADLDKQTAALERQIKATPAPTARHPFMPGQRMRPQMDDNTFKEFVDGITSARFKKDAEVEAGKVRIRTKAVSDLADYVGSLEAAARPPSGALSRFGNAATRRVTMPVQRFGQQVRRISGDAFEAAKPRAIMGYERGKKAFEDAKRIVFGGVNEKGQPVTGADLKVRQFLKEHPWAVRGAISAFASLGGAAVLDYKADGRIDLNYKKLPAPLKELLDQDHRPQASMFMLNGGRDVAFVTVGKMRAGKGFEGTPEIVLSGVIMRENGEVVEVTPLMPLKNFLANNGGSGGGGGGNKGPIQLSSVDAKAVSDAIGALRRDGKIKRVGGEDEDGFEFRDKDDNSQDNAAKSYLETLKREANNSRGGDKFYSFLASIFSENGAVLKQGEMRQALFGGRGKDGKPTTDGLFMGGAVFDGYHAQNAKLLADGLQNKLEKLPAPTAEQGMMLRHMVRLANRNNTLDQTTVSRLNQLIADRVAGVGGGTGGEGGAGASARAQGQRRGPKLDFASLKNEGDYQEALRGLYDFYAADIPEAMRSYMGAASKASAKIEFEREVESVRTNPSFAERTDKVVWDEAMKRLYTKWSKTAETYADRANKSFTLAELRKQSDALLAKASLPTDQAGFGARQFEEGRIRRQPRGSDKGGEFAPKAGGGAGGSAARDGKREPTRDERSYFEPTRLGNTVGTAIGSQAMWELTAKYLPGPLKNVGMVGKLAYQLGSSALGGVAGGVAGEEIGRASYTLRGKRPPRSYEPPERPLTEDAARLVGGLGGAALTALTRSPVKGFALGAGGQLGGEELAAGAHDVAMRLYGPEVAERVRAAATPRQSQG